MIHFGKCEAVDELSVNTEHVCGVFIVFTIPLQFKNFDAQLIFYIHEYVSLHTRNVLY